MVRKRGNAWCVLHGHSRKPGSPRDKPKGTVIKCYDFVSGNKRSESIAKAKAHALHRAIVANKNKSIEGVILHEECLWEVEDMFFGSGTI